VIQPVKTEEKEKVRPYAVMLVVGVGTLLTAMAGSTVNLALPDLGRDLNLSIESSRWVVQAFLLGTGVFMLPVGRLSDLLGHRRLYLIGMLIFGLASIACGLADDFGLLVGLRMLQGVGGAMAMATGPALLTTSFPPSQRGRALGMVATATYVGLTIGPSLGGAIVASLGWRWTFFLNLPVTVVVFSLGWFGLPRKLKRSGQSFDWTGALALFVGLPLVLLAISKAPIWGAGRWETWVTSAGGALALVTFVRLQRRSSSPLLNLGLFGSRVFTGAVLSALGNYVTLFAVILLTPFYLEEGLGFAPGRTGMLLSATPLVMASVAALSGSLSDRWGTRGLTTLGMLIMAAGTAGLGLLGVEGSAWQVAGWLGLIGLGTGIFISPNSSALMGAAPRAQQGSASAVLAESRVIGMLMGVVLSSAVFHALSGQTGQTWRPEDFLAYRGALLAAAGVGFLAALAAALRGRSK
jgi:EmrB/QacA subfamily drug resistance transporter